MSSIIDRHRSFAVLRFCGAACGVLVIWMVVAGLAAFTEPTSTVTVFGPRDKLMQAIQSSDVEILDAGRGFLITRGRTVGFVKALYSSGAWAVLPGGIGACASAAFFGRARVGGA